MQLTIGERAITAIVFLVFSLIGSVLLFALFPLAGSLVNTNYLVAGTSMLWLLIVLPILGTYAFVFRLYKNHSAHYYNLSLLVLAAVLFGSIAATTGLLADTASMANTAMVLSVTSKAISIPTPSLAPPVEPVAFASVMVPPKGVKAAAGTLAYVDLGQVFIIDGNGKNQTQLTDDDTIKFDLVVLPDGSKIAYRYYPLESDFESTSSLDEVASGVAIVTVSSKQIQNMAVSDDHRFGSMQFSLDGNYLSVWAKDRSIAKIFDTGSGIELSSVKSTSGTVSAMVWLTAANKVSYVSDGKLLVADVAGPGHEVIVEGADMQAPVWSSSGRYVLYYKKGDLFIFDTQNKTDVIIGSSGVTVIGWNKDETIIYLNDSSRKKSTIAVALVDGKASELDSLGESAVLSQDKESLMGLRNDAGKETTVTVIKLAGNTGKSCSTEFTYPSPSSIFHPQGEYAVGWGKQNNKDKTIAIFNTVTCVSYPLLYGKYVTEAIWMGK